jgi:hypothetical protein
MTVSVRANFTLRGWNANQLKLRVPAVMTAYGKAMDQQLKEEIQTPQFSWPRETKRRNGTLAGTSRNIVDTGAFLASQRRDRPNATTLRFSWGNSGVNYAGYILQGTTASYPPRDWIGRALNKLPFEPFFRAEWNRLGGRGA